MTRLAILAVSVCLAVSGAARAGAQGTAARPATPTTPATTLTVDLSVALAMEGAGLYFEGVAVRDAQGNMPYDDATATIHAKAIALLGLAETPEVHQTLADRLRIVSEDLRDNGELHVRALLALTDAADLQAAHRVPAGLPLLGGGSAPVDSPAGGGTASAPGPEPSQEQLEALLKASPDNPDLLLRLGLRYAASGKPMEALAAFDRAAQLLGASPKAAEARCNTAAVYFGQGRLVDALKQYRLALQVDANDALAHFGSGACYESLGEQGRARSEYAATLALAPDGPLAESARAALARLGPESATGGQPPAPGGAAPPAPQGGTAQPPRGGAGGGQPGR
jgi:tetratricopeptide (TPR) repeat protein